MRLARKYFVYLILSLIINLIYAAQTISLDGSLPLKRQKRFLIFPGGGTAKFVGGYLGPVDTEKFINCNAIRNVQFQYDLPPNITTIFSQVPARQRSFDGRSRINYKPDASRKIAYEIVEDILGKEGKNGRECLLRTICEVAETPVNHNGLVGELLQLFFTPGRHETLHQDFHHARKAGLNRVNCEKMYPDCPFGHGILDSVSLIEEFKFQDWLNIL